MSALLMHWRYHSLSWSHCEVTFMFKASQTEIQCKMCYMCVILIYQFFTYLATGCLTCVFTIILYVGNETDTYHCVGEQSRPQYELFNSLWPGDPIWRHGTRSTLAQVMACCLTAPSHYLNHQCWLIISKIQWHSSECNFTRDTSAIGHWN